MKPKFSFLTGDTNYQQYGGKFISQKFNNGDWDYWLVIEVINMYDAVGEREAKENNGGKYCISLMAVSPQAAGKENLEDAFECCGFNESQNEQLKNNLLIQVQVLSDYGIQAQLWTKSGNNLKNLLKECKKEAQLVEFLFGFYMDKPENMIGNTGWDFISGNIGFKPAC